MADDEASPTFMINELSLTNFRGFGSLELKGLKRVNLIVGHNNTGKTSLLEGLLILTDPHFINRLPDAFRPSQGNINLRYFRWLIKDGANDKDTVLTAVAPDESKRFEIILRGRGHPDFDGPMPQGFLGPDRSAETFTIYRSTKKTPPLVCRTISVQHRDIGALVPLIGKAYRKKDGEETLQRLLAVIDSRIKKVRIDPGEDGNQIIVDIGLSELVPLSQVGQGVYRVTAILADIIGEQPDVLLIDEIENGLHHSVMAQVWTGLAEIAEQLNVQIFATTHSGECLQAAHKAFLKRKTYDLAVIQLFRNESGVQGRVLDQEHIKAAIAEDIELR
jgi:ABC-type transport system involved in cytochrome c biogenesis ATPase subunit